MTSLVVLLFLGMVFLVIVFSRLTVLHSRRRKGVVSDEHIMISATTIVFGTIWIATWIYYLTVNWSRFVSRFDTLALHVGLQLLTGVLLIITGLGLYRRWAQRQIVYYSAMIVLFISSFVSLFFYGPQKEEEMSLMFVLGFLTFVVAGGFTLALHTIDKIGRNEEI